MKITLYIPQENNTFEPLEVSVDDNSYHYKEIMGDDNVVLNFSLADFMDLPVGTYFMYKDVYKYTLYSPENFKKNHSQHYDYTLTLESELAQLKTIKFKSFVAKYKDGIAVTMDTSPRLKFSFTGTPYEFAKLLADNLNLSGNETGWTSVKENCIQSERVTIDFNHDYCFDVLTRIAEAFNTEWDVEGREIRFAKVEKMKASAVKLSYGYKNGILGGIQRSQFDTSKVINRVWIQGGERNIRWDKYGNDTLLMPKNSTVRYDGAYFDDDAENTDKFDEEKAVEYRTDPSGCYVERTDRRGPLLEDSLDVSKVYPMREGTVTNAYENKDFWYFEDSGIPDTLDFAKCVLPDEKMTAIFQTGMLAGREFEVAYTHKKAEGEYIKRFQLIPREENGQTIPGGAFVPKTGDVYGVFHMDLPEEYVQDAERRARNEAIKYLYENAQPKYTYDWQLDGIYAKKQWGVSGGMLGCGNFVRFSDPQFLSEPVDIRITAVKTYIDRPQSPEITISNNVSGKSLGSILNEIPAKEQEIERGKQEAINYAKRRWKDTQELIDNIKGITDEFENDLMSSLVFEGLIFRAGAPSLQYQFLDEDWVTPVRAFIAYDEESKLIHVFDSVISHEVLQIDGHKPYWTVPEYMSDTLDPQTPYFLYIRASKNLRVDSQGRMIGEAEFFISDKKIKLEDEEGNYIFWVAFINSENEENERSIRSMYGYTELLPGQITADTLISSDGNSYMDFLLNQFKIGSKNSGMDWNISNKDTLSLTNAVIRNSLQVDDNAMIAGFKFYNDRIESSKEISNISSILLDGNSGAGHLAAKNIEWDENGDLIVKGSFQGKVVSKDDEGNSIEINATQKRINLYTFRGDLMGSWYYNSGKVGSSSELISRIFLRHIYYPENGEKVFQSQMTMSPSGIEFDMPLSHNTKYGIDGLIHSGIVIFKDLPTTPDYLPSGSIWRDGNSLRIKP